MIKPTFSAQAMSFSHKRVHEFDSGQSDQHSFLAKAVEACSGVGESVPLTEWHSTSTCKKYMSARVWQRHEFPKQVKRHELTGRRTQARSASMLAWQDWQGKDELLGAGSGTPYLTA